MKPTSPDTVTWSPRSAAAGYQQASCVIFDVFSFPLDLCWTHKQKRVERKKNTVRIATPAFDDWNWKLISVDFRFRTKIMTPLTVINTAKCMSDKLCRWFEVLNCNVLCKCLWMQRPYVASFLMSLLSMCGEGRPCTHRCGNRGTNIFSQPPTIADCNCNRDISESYHVHCSGIHFHIDAWAAIPVCTHTHRYTPSWLNWCLRKKHWKTISWNVILVSP